LRVVTGDQALEQERDAKVAKILKKGREENQKGPQLFNISFSFVSFLLILRDLRVLLLHFLKQPIATP
jgi:hypothetical protein